MKILIVEDEPKLATFISKVLTKENHEVTVTSSGEDVIEKKLAQINDLIILDLMLAGLVRGKDLVMYLKKEKIDIPIIVLSALHQMGTKIDLFNAGVDDYMTKPFEAEELLVRIKSVIRRYNTNKIDKDVLIGDIVFKPNESLVLRGSKEIYLTMKESDLLAYLILNANKVVKSEEIVEAIWKNKVGFHSNILQTTVMRLRKKLDYGFSHKYIRNIHGIGYVFQRETEE